MREKSTQKSLFESTPLNGEEASALALEVRKGNKAAQDKLVLGCMYLIHSAVKKTGAKENDEDLGIAGVSGLIKAVERFDPKKGLFTSFAYSYILDAVYEAIRKENHLVVLPNNVWRDKRRVSNFCEKYERTYGEAPTDEVIMESLEMTSKALGQTRMGRKVACVDQDEYHDSDNKTDIVSVERLTDDICYADSHIMTDELSELLKRLIVEVLNAKEREALLRYFGIGYEAPMKYAEIAELLGMNYQATRRLIEKAIYILKREVAKHGYISADILEPFELVA